MAHPLDDLHEPTRRSVLKKGLLGGLLLGASGAGLLAFRRGSPTALPAEGLISFDLLEFSVVAAIASRMIPVRAGFPSNDQVRVAFNADRVLARADPSARKDVKQLLRLVENGLANFLFGGRPQAFTALSPEAQDAVLSEWQASRLTVRRTGFQALRALVMASYYASPVAWAAVGYRGPPQGFHDPEAPVWTGAGAPRPPGNGVFTAPDEKSK